MKTKSKRTKSKPATLGLYPVMLYTEDGKPVECLQYCSRGERPLSGRREALETFDNIEQALQHYARACRRPVPLLILSAPVA